MEDACDGIRDNDATLPVDSTEIALPYMTQPLLFLRMRDLTRKSLAREKNWLILKRIDIALRRDRYL